MSLIRFLSSGSRGLTKDAAPLGRYRLPEGRLIPDFGSATNPFNPTTLPARETSSPVSGVTAKAASTQATPSSSVPFQRAARAQTARRLPRLLAAVRRVAAYVRPRCARVVEGLRQLPAALIRRLPRRQRGATATGSTARPVSGPVQGELLLENVRVVRNDLTDTDYEVVCAGTSTASPVKRVPTAAPTAVPSRPLGRLAERLFSQKTS